MFGSSTSSSECKNNPPALECRSEVNNCITIVSVFVSCHKDTNNTMQGNTSIYSTSNTHRPSNKEPPAGSIAPLCQSRPNLTNFDMSSNNPNPILLTCIFRAVRAIQTDAVEPLLLPSRQKPNTPKQNRYPCTHSWVVTPFSLVRRAPFNSFVKEL